MTHAIKMLIGCVIAFLLLFLLPILGFGDGVPVFVFLAAMFVCHLLMLGVHGRHQSADHPDGGHS